MPEFGSRHGAQFRSAYLGKNLLRVLIVRVLIAAESREEKALLLDQASL